MRILLILAFSAFAAQAQSLAVVNAADYVPQISPGSIASAFGTNLPTDASTSVNVCTPACTSATILAANSGQINFLVPDPLTATQVTVQVLHSGAVVASGTVSVSTLSPGIFTADNSGTGMFNGQSYDGGAYDSVFLNPSTPRAVSAPNTLILYGTGWKHAVASNVRVSMGGIAVTPDYAGPASDPGLDQLNVQIPAGLAGQTAQIVNLSVAFGAYNTRIVELCLAGENGGQNCPALPAPFPSCFEPLPGIAAPYAPHGLFALQPPGANPAPITNYIQKQPTVCGGDLYVVWSTVDQGNGKYNWTTVDSQLNQWVAAGKKVNFIVWGVSDAEPNNGTPAYVLNDPGFQSVSCEQNGQTLSYPVYYSGSYLTYYKTFIQAVLNRYGANSNVGYIRFGLARGGEVFPTCLTQMMAFSGTSTIAQFNTLWENYITEMTQYQQQLSGTTVQLMTALDQYGAPVQYAVTDFEAANAKSLGFGFGSQGLSQSDITAYQAGRLCTADWCSSFQNLYGLVPLELQTIAASDPTNAPGGTGSLVDLFPFALGLHTQILEVYIQDLQVAYDPTSPDYAKYGQTYQTVFQQTAAQLGFSGK
jgi:uncharacterized protein (TIGR03437 family)